MTINTWGNPTWLFLHTLVSKIKPDNFSNIKKYIQDIIIKLSTNLPCPECSNHSSQFLKNVKFENVQSKEDFIEILYVFHNDVNKRLNKELFPKENLKNYESFDIEKLFNNVHNEFNKPMAQKLMLSSFHRNRTLKEIKSLLILIKNDINL